MNLPNEKKTIIKSLKKYFKCYKSLLLSHHPNCERFAKNHTLNVGKHRFCMGCLIGYPTILITIIVIFFLKLYAFLNRDLLLILSLICISSLALSPLNLTKKKPIKIIQKLLISVGLGLLFWWIWTAKNLFFVNLLFFILIFGFLFFVLNAYHGYRLLNICKKCRYSLDWENCPGFKDIYDCLKKMGFK
ncbi:MAG TPA: hypothetical protein VGB37_05905 [Candidatus Lokiarchaeia archaeon]